MREQPLTCDQCDLEWSSLAGKYCPECNRRGMEKDEPVSRRKPSE